MKRMSRISQIADILGIKAEDILRLENTIALQNYADSRPHNSEQPLHNEFISSLKALYEIRINRLEDELLEVRKLLFDLLAKKL